MRVLKTNIPRVGCAKPHRIGKAPILRFSALGAITGAISVGRISPAGFMFAQILPEVRKACRISASSCSSLIS